MMPETCEDCRYWKKTEPSEGGWFGLCRRFPPTVTSHIDAMGDVLVQGVKTEWPVVDSSMWCGEFKEHA